MENRVVKCQDLNISNSNKICLIAGPCQLETEQHALDMAGKLKILLTNMKLDLYTKHHLIKLIEQVLKVKEELD